MIGGTKEKVGIFSLELLKGVRFPSRSSSERGGGELPGARLANFVFYLGSKDPRIRRDWIGGYGIEHNQESFFMIIATVVIALKTPAARSYLSECRSIQPDAFAQAPWF